MSCHRFRLSLLALSVLTLACGDDGASTIDAMPAPIDGAPVFSDGSGVACAGAQQLYQGSIFNPAASDDGAELSFSGNIDNEAGPERLTLRVASANPPAGTLSLPDAAWATSICLGAAEPCTNELVAYSGTLQINSTSDRLQASVTEAIFVDSLATPTCSAALSQATIDVAISGPP